MSRNPIIRAVALAGAVLFIAVAAQPVEAGLWSRLRGAGRALVSEAEATRGWIVFGPVRWEEGGDLRAIGLSVVAGDPSQPAFYVHFQWTDAHDVARHLGPGYLITLKKFTIDTAGPIPVINVQPYSAKGWRANEISAGKYARAPEFFATWGYLISGRILSADPENFDAFYRHRPDLLALLNRDAAQVDSVLRQSDLDDIN